MQMTALPPQRSMHTLILGGISVVTSPGGTQTVVSSCTMCVPAGVGPEDWPRAEVTRHQMPWGSQQYLTLTVEAPGQVIRVSIPPNEEQMLTEADRLLGEIMRPSVRAIFVPQQWVDDEALEVDGRVAFDVARLFSEMTFKQALEALKPGGVRDALADALPARRSHSGPFEVRVDEPGLARLVCLMSNSVHLPGFSSGRLAETGPEAWEGFKSGYAFARRAMDGEAPVLEAANDACGADGMNTDEAANEPNMVEGALARLVAAFGPGYPASLRADMNLVAAEMARMKAKPQPAAKPVATAPRKRPIRASRLKSKAP